VGPLNIDEVLKRKQGEDSNVPETQLAESRPKNKQIAVPCDEGF
jgi:hypothetical protein